MHGGVASVPRHFNFTPVNSVSLVLTVLYETELQIMEQADTPSADAAPGQKTASMVPSKRAQDSPSPQESEDQSKSTGGAKGAKRYNPRHGQGKRGKKKEVGRAEWRYARR